MGNFIAIVLLSLCPFALAEGCDESGLTGAGAISSHPPVQRFESAAVILGELEKSNGLVDRALRSHYRRELD